MIGEGSGVLVNDSGSREVDYWLGQGGVSG